MFDTLIAGGRVFNGGALVGADVAIADGRIAAIGRDLGAARETIAAQGHLVLPGGVDSHCHIEQVSGAGILNADTWESATRSAAFGGTTTVVSFAAQHAGQRLTEVVADYEALAARGALIDHAFHLIVADTSGPALTEDLPLLMGKGHRSIKVFTTYPKVRMDDEQVLDLLMVARDCGGILCVHAENDGILRWASRRLQASGRDAPRFHPASHPAAAEIEALSRMAVLAEFTGQPIMLFHVSTAEGAAIVRAARGRGAPVIAETCPHYLLMDVSEVEGDARHAAARICSPPQRGAADRKALWQALRLGDITALTSDHAPYRLDASGKFAAGPDAPFPRIANGMPGLETRLPLMFDAMVTRGQLDLAAFVTLTASRPAEIFGLTGKGRIAPGFDADIAIWDPAREIIYGADDLHDNTGYNPWEGRKVVGAPVTVLSRGQCVIRDGSLAGVPGHGRRVPMEVSVDMRPSAPSEGAMLTD
ncbi:dihydropyrimidinase [Paracoccus suum]|uniref:Dihydropyrimidinase n=1 Tax=Paracoccus suum TaxID=2259340 RepID=A0A344PMI1_9RHOB|nr:dihydropyrimidinase [Paracoccus suum]AXC50586.1 dihydropyrimidinase [Paracoccus suum]